MTIVHVTNYQVPGYGYEEIMLARAQARLSHNAIIVASNYLHPRGFYAVLRERFPRRRVEPSEEIVEGVRIIRLRGVEIGQRVWLRGLERQIRALKPDVVHCHNVMQFHPLRLALLKARRQSSFALIVDDHMHFSVMRRGLLGRAAYALFRTLVRPFLGKEVDRYCAIGADTRDYLMSVCGIQPPIDVRPLGVDTDVFKNSADRRARARGDFGVADGETVFVYTGKIIPAKGIHVLTKATLTMLERGARVRLIVVGDADPEYLQSLKADVGQMGRSEHFVFLPSRSQTDLPDTYAAADVAVWPRQESMAVYEALSMGLPVILSDASGFVSMLNGVVRTFPFDESTSLADVMQELISTRVREPLGKAARKLAEQKFSWNRAAERYMETYGEAMRRRRPA